ncbi:MAG: hypothetical protein M2R45_00701 [Verrucomicrobia subdivision 3 bacterium]|nr:hypothetical protein [Limisphaerales bacterium]MCS1414415.1 hypothetical protein [Limisphaerales bacterium]
MKRVMKPKMRRLVVWVGFLASAICLVLSCRSVPFLDFVAELKRIEWLWVLPAAFLLYLSMAFRAFRWRWLLGEQSGQRRVMLFEAVMVGYAFNNILPSGRVGELARAFYVSEKGSVPISMVFGTIINDRVFDALTILLLVGLTGFWILPIDPQLQVGLGGFQLSGEILNPLFVNVAVGSLGMVGLVLLLMLIPRRDGMFPLVLWRLPFLSDSIRDRVIGFFNGVVSGLHTIKNPRAFGASAFHTILVWGLAAATAYGLAWSVPGLSMSWFQAIGLMAIATVCAAIPSAPGFWGLYEAGMIFGFQVLDIHPESAVALAYGVTMHLIYYVPTTFFGLIFAGRSAIGIKRATSLKIDES